LQHLGQACIAQAAAQLQHGVEIADLHHLGDHPLGPAQGLLGLFPPDQPCGHGPEQVDFFGSSRACGQFQHRRARFRTTQR